MFNLIAILIACAAPSQDKHFVELEIIINERFGIDQGQEWIEVLSDVGADNVRLRRGNTSTRRYPRRGAGTDRQARAPWVSVRRGAHILQSTGIRRGQKDWRQRLA